MPDWFKEGLRFECTGCGKCCTGSPGYVFLSKKDVERLSQHLSLSSDEFLQKYTRLVDGEIALLDREESTDCLFLEGGQCTVYAGRPTQCRTFPFWLENLRSESDWFEAKRRCEGIDREGAPLIPLEKIEEECMHYLDNLFEE